jgi:hypothetical protein
LHLPGIVDIALFLSFVCTLFVLCNTAVPEMEIEKVAICPCLARPLICQQCIQYYLSERRGIDMLLICQWKISMLGN